MSIVANKNVVRRYQEIDNSNDLDTRSEIVADDMRTPKIMPGEKLGPEGGRQVHATTLIGMLDGHTAIDDLIAEDVKVAARITMTGTHTGDLGGIAATGKRVELAGIYVARTANGRIVEHWGEEDGVSLLQQQVVLKI